MQVMVRHDDNFHDALEPPILVQKLSVGMLWQRGFGRERVWKTKRGGRIETVILVAQE